MIFDIRPLKESDYDDTLIGWWNEWGWEPPTRDFLPDNGCGGIIVLDEGVPVCAGFIYITNSKLACVDWIVSSKSYRKKPHRRNAIGLLIETLTNIAENNGNKFSYALIKNNNLINTYKDLGYIKGDSYTGEMIKAL